MNWWKRLKAWLGWSKPEANREQLELWMEDNVVSMHDHQNEFFAKYGRFEQILPTTPAGMPEGCQVKVDVYEAPGEKRRTVRHGYSMLFSVLESDGSKWLLRVDPSSSEAKGWVRA